MKKYIAKTNVSVNVVLSNGTNCHITFSAVTGGGSVFYTDDAEVIKALESHYKYGKLFRADPNYISEKQPAKPALKPKRKSVTDKATSIPDFTPAAPATEVASEAAENSEQEEEEASPSIEAADSDDEIVSEGEAESEADEEAEAEENGFKTIVVSDPDAAKAYLAEHFGISRTKIKTLKAINAAAAANGIVFEGL